MVSFSEEELVRGCKKLDRSCQRMVFDKYENRMRGVCFRYANTTSDIDDLLQEGFIRVFSNIKKFNWKGEGSFEGWIKRVMINTAINYYKQTLKHANNVSLDDCDYQIENSDNTKLELSIIENAYSQNELMDLLSLVPLEFRIVFNMYAIEGYKHNEIAKHLKIKEETSRTRLLRAKKIMQKHLIETLGHQI